MTTWSYSGNPAERRASENVAQYELGESTPNGTCNLRRESERSGSIQEELLDDLGSPFPIPCHDQSK